MPLEDKLIGTIEDHIARPFSKYPDGLEYDWKIWFGTIVALVGFFFLVHLILSGVAVRPKDGYQYDDEDFLARVSYGFAFWRWGNNFIMLIAAQYYVTDSWQFYTTLLTPVIVITIEKLMFLWSYNCNDWLDKNYFNDDFEGNEATSRKICLQSIYEKFDPNNNFKMALVNIAQSVLVLFYMVGLQRKLSTNASPYPYTFWLMGFLVQESADVTGMFGADFNFLFWAFVVKNAGGITIENVQSKRRLTPTPCGVYCHFLFAMAVEMFARNLLIATLPLFLFTSDDPVEFMLDCVATGFVVQLSQSAQEGDYKITRGTEDESEDDDDDLEKSALVMDRGTEMRLRSN